MRKIVDARLYEKLEAVEDGLYWQDGVWAVLAEHYEERNPLESPGLAAGLDWIQKTPKGFIFHDRCVQVGGHVKDFSFKVVRH